MWVIAGAQLACIACGSRGSALFTKPRKENIHASQTSDMGVGHRRRRRPLHAHRRSRTGGSTAWWSSSMRPIWRYLSGSGWWRSRWRWSRWTAAAAGRPWWTPAAAGRTRWVRRPRRTRPTGRPRRTRLARRPWRTRLARRPWRTRLARWWPRLPRRSRRPRVGTASSRPGVARDRPGSLRPPAVQLQRQLGPAELQPGLQQLGLLVLRYLDSAVGDVARASKRPVVHPTGRFVVVRPNGIPISLSLNGFRYLAGCTADANTRHRASPGSPLNVEDVRQDRFAQTR